MTKFLFWHEYCSNEFLSQEFPPLQWHHGSPHWYGYKQHAFDNQILIISFCFLNFFHQHAFVICLQKIQLTVQCLLPAAAFVFSISANVVVPYISGFLVPNKFRLGPFSTKTRTYLHLVIYHTIKFLLPTRDNQEFIQTLYAADRNLANPNSGSAMTSIKGKVVSNTVDFLQQLL